MPPLDVLVVGKGPAGLAAAAALVGQGLAVGVLAPAGTVHWPAEYGAWADDLEVAGFGDLAEFTWSTATVGLGNGRERVVPRAYVRVDKRRLTRQLIEQCELRGVRWLEGTAASVRHERDRSTVLCGDGAELAARVVVDASGHRPVLLHAASDATQGFQTAFGLTLQVDNLPFEPDRMVLMDWDDAHLSPAERAGPPTFLYAMPLGDGRLFVEETTLVGRPAVPFSALEHRLHARLRAWGIATDRVLDVERCWIPMGGALPAPQRVVGFGGAAGMVHPATGYLLTRVLEDASRLAAAIATALGSGTDPEGIARAGWDALWPADRRRRHELFRFGMEALLRLDAPRTRDFFDAFFDLPAPDWQGYFGDRLPAGRLAAVMGRLFLSAPSLVRRSLARSAAGLSGLRMLRTLLRPANG